MIRKVFEKAVLSSGVITSAGDGGMNIETGKDASELQGDWEQTVRDLGGDPHGPASKPRKDGGMMHTFPDGTVIMARGSKLIGQTLHIQVPQGPEDDDLYDMKRRYR